MTFDQAEYDVRCEWGLQGVNELAPISDVVIIVDVLSFSTAVDIAVGRGGILYPYGSRDNMLEGYAREREAQVAEKVRTQSGFSLSPASLREMSAGCRLVLPSPNGGALCLAAAAYGRAVFTACLRNASAVAEAARVLGPTVAVIPAGERWPDGSLRPSFEDWIGAGAVLASLPGELSPEARSAVASFSATEGRCFEALAGCSSGKELIERGFAEDVALAAEICASTTAPILECLSFSASGRR